jgi:hypothetical protein
MPRTGGHDSRRLAIPRPDPQKATSQGSLSCSQSTQQSGQSIAIDVFEVRAGTPGASLEVMQLLKMLPHGRFCVAAMPKKNAEGIGRCLIANGDGTLLVISDGELGWHNVLRTPRSGAVPRMSVTTL